MARPCRNKKKSKLCLNLRKQRAKKLSTPVIKLWSPVPIRQNSSSKKHSVSRRRFATPLKRTPKRARTISPIYNPQTLINTSIDYEDVTTHEYGTQTDYIYNPLASDDTCSKLSHQTLDAAMGELSKNDPSKSESLLTFLNLVQIGKYPLDNISFLLFLETIRFF